MHELPVTESILDIVLKHGEAHKVKKIVGVGLRIGEMSDLVDEWIQKYFDYLSKGTIAEGAKLDIERAPVKFTCNACGATFQVDIRTIQKVICPECGGEKHRLVSGREFFIKNIAVI
ncbi:MAG: hydrogenase maturation nickel metallochaperone HypA [Deltaproteobacteria bacterium]|nr:hydrogenase maturation nickel metallochaperone HypA [Deltaproteobacteria bacterium]